MCYDPWELGIYGFANLYTEAVEQSRRTDKTESFRQMWAGKAEGFERQYPEKLRELDAEDLSEWLLDINDWSGESKERLLRPAEAEQQRREEAVEVV